MQTLITPFKKEVTDARLRKYLIASVISPVLSFDNMP